MQHGVFYLLTATTHAVRLIVSLWSLRKHYSGPVTVYTTIPESHSIGIRCSEDRRLNVEHRSFPMVHSRKNASFLIKLALLEHVPYEVSAYLDADTLIAGDIAPLLDVSENDQFHATQFSNWNSTTRRIAKRIKHWETVSQDQYSTEEWHKLLQSALDPHPAVNGGVFAYRRNAELLDPWYELSLLGRRTFICDEIALQILLHHYPHRVLDSRWNCSPIYGAAEIKQDVRIWHMHGSKHLHSDALGLWWPAYEECVRENVARINDWTPGRDKRLAGFLQTSPSCLS